VLLNVSLNSFFGYGATTLFDPRVVFDHVYNRWIVAAEAFPESATVQRQFIAVSTSSNAAGSYFKYNFDVNIFNNSEFWDYPQLGFDDTAILLTANIFNPGYVGSRIFQVSKHRMYAGKAVTPCFWFGGPLNFATIAPPLVRDLNNQTWFASAATSSSIVRVTRWTALDRVCDIFLGTTDIPVGAYVAPPNAPQPGTAQQLDTLDARFVNAGTQRGNFLYNIHSIDFGGAALRYYKLNVPTGTAAQNITFFSSGISSDFNGSVAVNDVGNVYVTFSRSDTATFPQVRFAGKQDADAGFGLGTVFTSPSSLTGNSAGGGVQRWGDYSSITIDPTSPNHAWGTNEKVNAGGGTWGSRIFRIGIP